MSLKNNLPKGKKCLEFLAATNREKLLAVLGKENIRTIAVILANCEHLLAAKILASLPGVIQKQVAVAMKTAKEIDSGIVEDIAASLKEKLRQPLKQMPSASAPKPQAPLPSPDVPIAGAGKKINYGGPEVAAAILKYANSEVKKNLEHTNPELYQQLQSLLFTFDDFARSTNKTVQVVFSQVPAETIVLALKVSTPKLREKILENLSPRKSKEVEDELEKPIRLSISAIEKAHDSIIHTALDLQKRGLVVLDPESEVV